MRPGLCARAVLGLLALVPGCTRAPQRVAYDLAGRAAVAERWSAAEVLLFGTPDVEPRLAEGFHREGAHEAEPFLWSRGEAEVLFEWGAVEPRLAVADLAPYRGVSAQSVEVHLNGAEVARFRLNDARHRYRIELPAEPQRPGENRLRFVFAATAAPADQDPASLDQRHLAAAFYSLVMGRASDASLDDLLGRDAPRPFSAAAPDGIPALTLVGPALVRFALRVPPGAELRFTPELHPSARAAGAEAVLRVTCERSGGGGADELWSRRLGAGEAAREVVLALPGATGEILKLGLEVSAGASGRFAWGVFRAPRILGRGAPEAPELDAGPPPGDERADRLRRTLAGSNVVLVVLDAARARQFGAYGYTRPTTPEIDRLAAEGVLFEQAYTPAAYTLGAMSSLWTSQYPDRHHGDVSFSAPLSRDSLTLADVLSAQGVHTAGFVANLIAGGLNNFDHGFLEFHELWREHGSRGDVFRKVLPGFLQANRDRRFFAYVHFREPHHPYDPEPPFDTRFGPDGPIPKAARADITWITEVNQGRRPLSEAEREHLVRLYDGNLAFADQEIGALRRALEQAGLLEKTVLIVTSDHGEELFEHGWIGHNVHVYEPSVRVPLVVRFPASAGLSGRRVRELVDLLDLAPTVTDVFGLRGAGGSDRSFQGRSLLPLALGAPGKPFVLSRTVWDRPRYGLRDGRWTLLYETRTGAERLFDAVRDPEERSDLARGEPLRAAHYRQTLNAWTRSLARPLRSGAEQAGAMSREQCEGLKSLGYLGAGHVCPDE